MTQGKRLNLWFGALVPPLAEQLKAQGFKLPRKELSHFQRDVDEITRLKIRGVLSDSERSKAHVRIFKAIAAEVHAHQARLDKRDANGI